MRAKEEVHNHISGPSDQLGLNNVKLFRVRIFAVAPGGSEIRGVKLFTRPAGAKAWTPTAMKMVGRRTYVAEIEALDVAPSLMDYYVAADFSGGSSSSTVTTPPEAPTRFYTVTML